MKDNFEFSLSNFSKRATFEAGLKIVGVLAMAGTSYGIKRVSAWYRARKEAQVPKLESGIVETHDIP